MTGPGPFTRWTAVWLRNFRVWRRLAKASVVGNLGDPLLYMLGMGYGIGALLPHVGGMPYLAFVAAGTVCYSTMNSATFEGLYSAFARMHEQRTWEGILNAPLTVADVVFGEWMWCASKSLLSGLAIVVVINLLGLVDPAHSLLLIPVALLSGLCFAGMALAVTAVAPGYDSFLYYFTLAVTPMTLLCGVFFPPSALPPALQAASGVLPLTHAIQMARDVLQGHFPARWPLHCLALAAWGAAGFLFALRRIERRLQR